MARLASELRRSAEPALAGDLLCSLAVLSPASAVDWLLSEEMSSGASMSAGDLAAALTIILEKLQPAGELSSSVSSGLLARYRDVVTADVASVLLNAAAADGDLDKNELRKVSLEVLEREPRHPGLLRVAAELARQSGDDREAHALLNRLGQADGSQATVHRVWRLRRSLGPTDGKPLRAAMLSSFTADALVPYLDLECRGLGLAPEFFVAPFNSWAQEIIAEDSALREFDPEIAFLAISIDDLVPELAGAPSAARLREAGDEVVERLVSLAETFSEWSTGLCVLHSLYSAHGDPFGIAQDKSGLSRIEWLAGLNARLREGLRELPRAYLLDMEDVLVRRSAGAFDIPKMRHLGGLRICGSLLGEVARKYLHYIAPLKGLTRKCVVVDLDNTLWGGIVGEDGPHGIKLGNTAPGSEFREFQQFLASLTERGFLLAINSKNNPEDALEVIRSHEWMVLREDTFSAMRINWLPKPENMLSLADELNIGIDSFVFIDDNPNERELMRQSLPDILTPEMPADPALFRRTIESLPQLQQLVITETDRTRLRQYRERGQRERAKRTAASLEGYLQSLNIEVEIGLATDATLPRVHQLFERTNQFNQTTRRYDSAQLTDFADDPGHRLYTVRVRDRFGDHGLVATALVREAEECWTIDSLLMSCRVIGYGIETALLAVICRDTLAAGTSVLVGEYIQTKKNEPAREFYRRHGFVAKSTSAEGVEQWQADLKTGAVECPDWIGLEKRDGP